MRGGTTIVAPATPPGTGAVAVVRLSGPAAFAVEAAMTGREGAPAPAPRALVRRTLLDALGRPVDDALVVRFPAPGSFTGEDLVEFHLHGNPRIVEAACLSACARGAVPAEAGEFTRRAFLNGKLDLAQAEGVADLIAARSDGAVRAALSQLRGGIGARVAPVRARLLRVLTALEGAIDFADEEDVPEASPATLLPELAALREAIASLLASFAEGHRMRDGATVVIAGVANVGKSRLLNRLLGEERAIVAAVPGTTRDYLTGEAELSGFPVRYVDTAGLRETDDPVEAEGVRRSRELAGVADLVLFVLDGSRPACDGDRAAYDGLSGRPHLLLLNKSDLPPAEDGEGFAGAGRIGALRLSARTGEGVGPLRAAIAGALFPPADAAREAAPLTRLRHRDAAVRADAAIARAEAALSSRMPPEFAAADVREGANALAELTGAIAPDEVLDAIFSSFCVGK